MNNQEAKFILGAFRPDGRDAGDAQFTEALAQAERVAELRTWFERERKFDAMVGAKLQAIAPPPELRQAILAGVRASRPRRHWWLPPAWLSAAAAVLILGAISFTAFRERGPGMAELSGFAISDLADSHDEHVGYPAGFEALQARLSSASLPLTNAGGLDLNLDELQRKNCRTVRVAGREVFEICFQRDGVWYHLYAGRRSDFRVGADSGRPLIASRGSVAGTAWADTKNVYALVTAGGQDALRRLL